MKSWKSASLPLCGVAVISRKCRVSAASSLPELVALGVLDLVAEEVRGHLVRLVHDDEVPVGLLQLGLTSSFRGQLVEARDDEVLLENQLPVREARGVVGHDLEGRLELADELVLPLLDEVPGQTIRQR
ncbi:MAG: hypothetical protein KatS3mg123_1753 [Burkholderiales bacterium]|nr:MAG: hypothetical protein KatS3mg123_1753 [Burkholderiales bacterium]